MEVLSLHNTLYNIGSSYTIQISKDKELLIEDDPTQKELQKSQEEKQAKQETKEQQKANKDNPNELSEEEKQQVKKLQARDAEVKAHESAHQAAGGGMAGAASFTYQQGPDGKMYAIGGEVPISMKKGATPQETIANARQVIAAAMAPANPSGQDFAVASSAKVMEMKAQQQLAKEEQEKLQGQNIYKNLSNELLIA